MKHNSVLCAVLVISLVCCVSALSATVTRAVADGKTQSLLNNYPVVKPGALLPVSITARNDGTSTWAAGSVKFVIVDNSFGWSGGPLKYNQAVKPSTMAVFTGKIKAPGGKIAVQTLTFQASNGNVRFGDKVNLTVSVDCTNGNSCDGEELFVNGRCRPATRSNCGYRSDCVTQSCNTTTRVCSSKTQTSSCEQCSRNCDYLGCAGRQCGSDGCGGVCGQCAYGTYCDDAGQCITTNKQGTCTNPFKILDKSTNLTGVYIFTANTSEYYHYHVIPCNVASTSPEVVWSFVVPPGQSYGFDIRSYNFDTVLDVRVDSCDGTYIGCNDDGTPPGNFGSRVARLIGPGKYLIIAKGYDVTQQGVVEVRVSFQPNCIPKCNSQFCGDDECGGQCGTCESSETCSTNFKCVPKVCAPDCSNNECGFDGCGGYCGSCQNGTLCNLDTNQCQLYPDCDGLNPKCKGGCGKAQFCASDCSCYNTARPLPDLLVDKDRLASDILFDQDVFKETSCAVREGCVGGTGRRRLLRFSVLSTNQGRAAVEMPSPGSRPDIFSYSPCHGHYHFRDYAFYGLLDSTGSKVLEAGRKQGYCILDGSRQVDGAVNCLGTYTCQAQGISPGWADTYTFDLDCQWIDITDTPPGNYLLFVELNRARKLVESDYENNKAYVPVTIPPWEFANATQS